MPWERPEPPAPGADDRGRYERAVQGRPPASHPTDVFDVFVFDAHDPAAFMRDVSYVAGRAVLPPRWALGYMQSHRELRDEERSSEELMLHVEDSFREKEIPLDALWLHYPEDERARAVHTEYLWGRDLLIAPVFEPGATSRDVYLPEGVWYDWWIAERREGGATVTRDVDLSVMPIYARAGAIIPVDPVRQYMDQEVDGPTTIRMFGGADGAFTMYEDDGISLDYLEGRGTWTRMTWDDDARRLTIEPGGPPAAVNILPERRTFRIELLPGGETRTVRYDGARVGVGFADARNHSTKRLSPSSKAVRGS